jgi:uncharacterized membrane protein
MPPTTCDYETSPTHGTKPADFQHWTWISLTAILAPFIQAKISPFEQPNLLRSLSHKAASINHDLCSLIPILACLFLCVWAFWRVRRNKSRWLPYIALTLSMCCDGLLIVMITTNLVAVLLL